MLKMVYYIYRVLFARRIFYKFNKLLYNLSLKGLGILNFESDKISGEEHFVKHHISNIEKGVIFDVGANVGTYSKLLRESNQNIEIYSFEPHPVTYQRLLENIENMDVKTFNVGVGSMLGTLNLYDYADNDGSSHASLYKEVIEEIHKVQTVEHEVKIITLTAFANEHEIERVKLLKIDTEGHEMEVLKGFEQLIMENKVDLIHFEFNEMNVASRVFLRISGIFCPIMISIECYQMDLHQ